MSVDWLWSVDAKIPSDTDEARKIVDEMLQKLTEEGWGDEDTFGVHLAVEEALMNAIKHGNQLDPGKTVQVDYRFNATDLEIEVEDEGPGFDPSAVPDPTLEENLELPSGRGLMLMRTFMGTVDYNERGNRVSMTKVKGVSPQPLDDDE